MNNHGNKKFTDIELNDTLNRLVKTIYSRQDITNLDRLIELSKVDMNKMYLSRLKNKYCMKYCEVDYLGLDINELVNSGSISDKVTYIHFKLFHNSTLMIKKYWQENRFNRTFPIFQTLSYHLPYANNKNIQFNIN